MITYIEIKMNGKVTCIKKLPDNAFIPIDELNHDYRNYREWVKKGNVPKIEEY